MRALAPWLGFLLFCNWIAAAVGFRLGMELFADFKIEMPILTLFSLWVTATIWLWPVTSFVAWSSVLLGLRTRIGWWLGLAVCLLCDVMGLGFVLPIVALINGLQGADDVAALPVSFSILVIAPPALPLSTGFLLMLASFILTQLIFAALIVKRRHWLKPK